MTLAAHAVKLLAHSRPRPQLGVNSSAVSTCSQELTVPRRVGPVAELMARDKADAQYSLWNGLER